MALGIQALEEAIPETVIYGRYALKRGNTPNIHPLVLETESKVIRAEACADTAHQLKQAGFTPDLICAHPGWGEMLFLKTIWPHTPMLCYQEFFYNTKGYDLDLIPNSKARNLAGRARTQMKNAYLHLSLEQATWNVSATAFQRSSFPSNWQPDQRIHDGINTKRRLPIPQRPLLGWPMAPNCSRGNRPSPS